jgi:hypothetical protein
VHISEHTFDDWVRQYQRLLFGEIPLDEVMEKSGETIDLRSDGTEPRDFLVRLIRIVYRSLQEIREPEGDLGCRKYRGTTQLSMAREA